jgi:hypothetical protein
MPLPTFIGPTAATSILLSQAKRAKPILFVEGLSEVHLLLNHFPEFESQIVFCGGHAEVKAAISVVNAWEVSNSQKLRVLGFIDKDYGGNSSFPRVTMTSNRDIEIDLYLAKAGEKLIREKASSVKCTDPRATITAAVSALRVLGLIRKYNADNNCGWAINKLQLDKYVLPDGIVDNNRIIETVLNENSVTARDAAALRLYLQSNPNVRTESIVRGHDLSALIGKWLRKQIGNRSLSETAWSVLEEDLRLATESKDLTRYTWGRRIKTHFI